jgi:hypothetical protein
VALPRCKVAGRLQNSSAFVLASTAVYPTSDHARVNSAAQGVRINKQLLAGRGRARGEGMCGELTST